MNKYLDTKMAQMIAAGVSACFLLIHVAMLVLFWACGVAPMVYFNVFSVAFYVLCFFLIVRKMFRAFVTATFFEVQLHMVAAVCCVGWGGGFQVTLVGVNMLVFFAEYVGRTIHIRHTPALPLGIVGMLMYLGAFAFTSAYPPQYALPEPVEYWLQIAWGVITFAITITCLEVFTRITFRSEELLSTEAAHDKLTGLPNRYFISDYLAKAADEEGLDAYWLAIADIDDFKVINDTYGHVCGDYVLKTLAEILNASEPGAKVCRWGGEEFLLVGKVGEGMDAVHSELERLRRAIAEHTFWYEADRLGLTVTIGAAAYDSGESVIEWVNRADKNLYAGKRGGKNQVVM